MLGIRRLHETLLRLAICFIKPSVLCDGIRDGSVVPCCLGCLVAWGAWLLRVPSRCLPDAFQVPSRCLPGAFQVPLLFQMLSRCLIFSRCLPGAFQVPSRCLPSAFQVPSRCFPRRHLGGTWKALEFQVPSKCLPGAFQESTWEALGKHLK